MTTPLCAIMSDAGSDKGPRTRGTFWHNYTEVYDCLFKDMVDHELNVFELGLGTTNPNIPSNMGSNGVPGASIRGWKNYFTQSRIFGADIDRDILFDDDRIHTVYCDQMNPDVIRDMWSRLPDMDIIIEDGLHTFVANVTFFESSIHKLKEGGFFIVEDISNNDIVRFNEKIQQWRNTYPALHFQLRILPHPTNIYDNNLLVVQRQRTKMTLANWQTHYKDPKTLIVQASHPSGDDSWQSFPIGMHYQYPSQVWKGRSIQFGGHDSLVLCAMNPDTDQTRRPHGKNRRSILTTLSSNGIHNERIPLTGFYDRLPQYKFIISPEGNGIDCHRHYEAILAGCIPIIERNPLIEEKYAGCPILYTDDYSEITPDYLIKTYEAMRESVYDFSSLFLSKYDEQMRARIKEYGNHWMRQHTKTNWY